MTKTTRSMAGSVFDLSDPAVSLPEYFIVDTNIVAEGLLARVIRSLPGYNPQQAQRADDVFDRLERERLIGFVTPVIYSEFIDIAIKVLYQQDAAARGTQTSNWLKLYKANPAFIQSIKPELESLRFLLSTNRLRFLSPDELGPIGRDTTFAYRLIELCWTHSLDTQDAGILFEAERLGVTSIVTLDNDLLRAQTSFDIYTWL
jgi:predicted nucleic acid-binding protein